MANYSYQVTNNTTSPQSFTVNNQTFHVDSNATVSITVGAAITALPSYFSFSQVNADGSLTLIQASNSAIQSDCAFPLIDRSGSTSSTAGKYTQIAGPNVARQYFRVINLSNAVLYVYDKNGTPTQNSSIPIPVGGGYVFDIKVTSTSIQVMSLTASCLYEAAEG